LIDAAQENYSVSVSDAAILVVEADDAIQELLEGRPARTISRGRGSAGSGLIVAG
jgi:hypothetical protein